jgi:FkbH-like protein
LLLSPVPSADAENMLAAFARVDAAGCLQFLDANPEQLCAIVSPGALSQAVSDALREFPDPSAVRPYVAGIALHYGEVLTPASAADVFETLGSRLDSKEGRVLERLLERFPSDPRLLRAAVGVARDSSDSARLDDLLTRLGRADPSPGTVSFVRRLRPPQPASSASVVRIALASSYTIDPLVPYADLACRALGLAPDIYVAPFNSWARETIDEASGLRRFEPEIVFLAISIDDLIPQMAGPVDGESLDALGRVALERVVATARSFATLGTGAPLVIHSFHSAFAGSVGIAESRERRSRSLWLADLNLQLADALRRLPATYLLDIADAVADGNGTLADNPKMRHIAGMRLPPQSLASIGAAYSRYVAPLKGLTKKCVVVDLDNTLWGGVVGEDGKNGIRLGNTSPGSEFVEFQQYLESLSSRGILLAVNSKNNEADALEVIRTHEAMVLREPAFSAMRINWKPKPENMIAIAEELNLGLDSLVFIDDNPDEREQMRQLLPQVLTVDLPLDPALYRSVLARLPQLATLSTTEEDRARARRYRAAGLRDRVKLNAASVQEYLRSLEIESAIAPAGPSNLPRVAQLFARTNQFNTTTRRYETGKLQGFIQDPGVRLWTLSSKDRFGDHGLVALALVRVNRTSWTIDSFLMSCRVIGYGIETALLAYVADRARAAGASDLIGEFVETKKNVPAKDFFGKHGFVLAESEGDLQRWRFPLVETLASPIWIRCEYREA